MIQQLTPVALCNYTTGTREYRLVRPTSDLDIFDLPKESFMTDEQVVSDDYYRVYVGKTLHGLALKINSIEAKMGQYTAYYPQEDMEVT